VTQVFRDPLDLMVKTVQLDLKVLLVNKEQLVVMVNAVIQV
jgi:hypothetical protein